MTVVVAVLVTACASGCGGEPDGTAAEPPPPPSPPVTPEPPAPPTLGPELLAIAKSIDQRQTDAARARLQAYLGRHPEDGCAEFLMGLTFHREKRYALARPRFERAVELTPG
jgi:hypothetical protein